MEDLKATIIDALEKAGVPLTFKDIECSIGYREHYATAIELARLELKGVVKSKNYAGELTVYSLSAASKLDQSDITVSETIIDSIEETDKVLLTLSDNVEELSDNVEELSDNVEETMKEKEEKSIMAFLELMRPNLISTESTE